MAEWSHFAPPWALHALKSSCAVAVSEGQAERPGAAQREAQVLLVQLDAEAGLEVALDHPLAVHLEDARVGEAAHQRLAHAHRIGAGLGRKQQRLADRLDRRGDDDLVGDLARLAVAVAADQRDVLAHQLEERLDLVERVLAAHHDGERRALGADLAARDGRVEIVAAELVDALGELLGLDRARSSSCRRRSCRATALRRRRWRRTAPFDVRRVGNHRDDDVGFLRDLLGIRACHASLAVSSGGLAANCRGRARDRPSRGDPPWASP